MTTHKTHPKADPRLTYRALCHVRLNNLLSQTDKERALRLRFDDPVFCACYELAVEESKEGIGLEVHNG